MAGFGSFPLGLVRPGRKLSDSRSATQLGQASMYVLLSVGRPLTVVSFVGRRGRNVLRAGRELSSAQVACVKQANATANSTMRTSAWR